MPGEAHKKRGAHSRRREAAQCSPAGTARDARVKVAASGGGERRPEDMGGTAGGRVVVEEQGRSREEVAGGQQEQHGRSREEVAGGQLEEHVRSREEVAGGQLEEQGRSREEVAGGQLEEQVALRWRVQQLEREKLKLSSAHNQEVCQLRAHAARLRGDVERGEAHRQTLEYQLAVSRRRCEQNARLTESVQALQQEVCDQRRALELSKQAREEDQQTLQQEVCDQRRALELSRQAREEDQQALQQEVAERDALVLNANAENERLSTLNAQLHTLLQESEEAIDRLKRRLEEEERERERQQEAIRSLHREMEQLAQREEERRRDLEVSQQQVRCLQGNMEAERSSHLESKYNCEVIQLRARDAEAALAVERTSHQEAVSSLQLVREQLTELQTRCSVERDSCLSATTALDRLQQDYQLCCSELSVVKETERQASTELEEEKRAHAHTHTLLQQATTKQTCAEQSHQDLMKQLRHTLLQYTPATSGSGCQGDDDAAVLEQMRMTLLYYQHTLQQSSQQVQDLLCASEKLQEDNHTLSQLTTDQNTHIQESSSALSSLQEEVTSLRQEVCDWSRRVQELQQALEEEKEARRREAQAMEQEREAGEARQKEEESFLYSLYQHLLAGCVLMDPSQGMLGTFSRAELHDVIMEQANQLISDLHQAKQKVSRQQAVIDSRSECVRRLQQGQQRMLSRLEQCVQQREEGWSSLRRQLEEQHSHAQAQLQKLHVSQVSSLEEQVSSLCSQLQEVQTQVSCLRCSSLLLAGALQHTLRRAAALRAHKGALQRLLGARDALEGEVQRLTRALGGGDGGEGRGGGARRWRVCVCVVLAVRRMEALAARTDVLLRVDTPPVGVARLACPHTEGNKESLGSLLQSEHLSSLLLSSMTHLHTVYSHADSSPEEVMSAAHSSLSRLLGQLLSQSDDACGSGDNSLVSRLGRGLAQYKPAHPSGEALVSSLQDHFLMFSQRLYSAEVERRSLRLELASQKRAAGRQRHKDPCDLVPTQRFESVCVELRAALNREDEAQLLLKEQSTRIVCLSKELRRKEQSLRTLGEHLSGVQRDRRVVEERLRQVDEDLRKATSCKDSLVSCMDTAVLMYTEVRDALFQSRRSASGRPLTLRLPRVPGAESMLGTPEKAVCRSLLSTISDLVRAASSRIGRLEQEVSALRAELQDTCPHGNQDYVPVIEYTDIPLVEQDASQVMLPVDPWVAQSSRLTSNQIPQS